MCIMFRTLIVISSRGIEINFVFNLLRTTVEILIPSNDTVHPGEGGVLYDKIVGVPIVSFRV